MRGAESSPESGAARADADWGPWTEDDGSSDAIGRRERLRRGPEQEPRRRGPLRHRRRRRGRRLGRSPWSRRPRGSRAPRSSTVLTVLAGLLAAVGVTLIVVAASAQVSAPTLPPVSAPSGEQVVPVAPVDPALQPSLLAAPWATGPSPLGPHPARWWWGDLVDSPRGLLPRGPSPGRTAPASTGPAATDPAELARLRALAAVPVSPPTTISIPTIRVSSPVDDVGLTPTGEMEVPAPGPAYDHAAWFRSSVTPGRQGPSVIIGHIDSRANGPSVFFDLGRLRAGDHVDVRRADGVTVSYAVTDVRAVAKDAFPTEAVYGATRGSELRLITCGGSFDSTVRSYRDNIVVFAQEIPPPPVPAAAPVPTTPSPDAPARIPAHGRP